MNDSGSRPPASDGARLQLHSRCGTAVATLPEQTTMASKMASKMAEKWRDFGAWIDRR